MRCGARTACCCAARIRGIVTAIVGIIDPATLQFRYAAAGHPAPLLATADGICTPLPGEGSGHRARRRAASRDERTTSSRFRSTACSRSTPTAARRSTSDGSAGTQTLADALVETRTLAPSKPAITIDRAIFGQRERDDDATIMTIAPEPQLAHLDVRLPAELASAPLARTALRRFLASTPLGERRSFDAVVAAGEAVANAIEHAYDRRPNQTFVVRARYENQTLHDPRRRHRHVERRRRRSRRAAAASR